MRNLVPVRLSDEESVESVVMFADRQTIQSARVLRDSGEMIAPVTIARTGLMQYYAKELGPQFADLPANQIVMVDTPASVLFDEATIELCRSMAVTVGHPKQDVDLTNNKELQKGFVEGVPMADGSHLSGYIVLNDKDAIALVDSGVDQTSWGHDAVLERVEKDGVVSAVKTKITSVNHLAIVRRGRAQTTRIGDSGEEIEIVDKAKFDVVEAERDNALDKIAKLEAKLADASASKLSDADVQAMVDERVVSRTALLMEVAKLGDEYAKMEFTAKTDAQIRREVVQKIYDKQYEDRSDDYILARFEAALEDADTVTLGDALSQSLVDAGKQNNVKREPSPDEAAYARRMARYNK